MARSSRTPKRSHTAAAETVGPPLALLGLGFASVLVSVLLVPVDGISPHLVGYVTGAIVPVFLIGLIRRVDLERRQNPHYVAKATLSRGLLVLALAGVVAAALHVWPIATELAS